MERRAAHVEEIKRMADEGEPAITRIEHGSVEFVIVGGVVDRMVIHHSIKNRRERPEARRLMR